MYVSLLFLLYVYVYLTSLRAFSVYRCIHTINTSNHLCSISRFPMSTTVHYFQNIVCACICAYCVSLHLYHSLSEFLLTSNCIFPFEALSKAQDGRFSQRTAINIWLEDWKKHTAIFVHLLVYAFVQFQDGAIHRNSLWNETFHHSAFHIRNVHILRYIYFDVKNLFSNHFHFLSLLFYNVLQYFFWWTLQFSC